MADEDVLREKPRGPGWGGEVPPRHQRRFDEHNAMCMFWLARLFSRGFYKTQSNGAKAGMWHAPTQEGQEAGA